MPYGGRPVAAPRATDRRYHGARWRKLREQILRRDGYRCRIVAGCDLRANVADHVTPVYPGMSDAEFFDPANLRAGCWPHNRARAFEAVARRRVGLARVGVTPMPRGVRQASTSRVVTGDYTRRDEPA